MSVRLSTATLHQLPPAVARPGYDRDGLVPGVLHFGPGAFHRAHQASYFDDLAERDPRWGITAVSLQSTTIRYALDPQDGLYTMATLDNGPALRVIGAVRRVLAACEQVAAVASALAHPALRLVTITVTEKGYPIDTDGMFDSDQVAGDLARHARRR